SLPSSPGRVAVRRVVMRVDRSLPSLAQGLLRTRHPQRTWPLFGCSYGTMGTTTLKRLLELAHEVDFATFVFAPDDWTSATSPGSPAPDCGQASARIQTRK